MSFDLPTIILIAGATVAVIGIVLALATPQGREAFAGFGLRVAEALVNVLIGKVSEPKRQAWAARTLPRAVEALPPHDQQKMILRVLPSDGRTH